jgi:hypothetical protein
MRTFLLPLRASGVVLGAAILLAASASAAAAQCFSCGHDDFGSFCRSALAGSATCNTIGIIFTECHLGSASCGWAAVEIDPAGRGRLLAEAKHAQAWTPFGLGVVRRVCGGVIVERQLGEAENAQVSSAIQTLVL